MKLQTTLDFFPIGAYIKYVGGGREVFTNFSKNIL